MLPHDARVAISPPSRTRSGRSPRTFALALVAMVFACAGAKPPFRFQGPEPVTAADRAMARLAERYLDASLKLSPLTASYVGYRKWDHLLPDPSIAGVGRAVSVLRAFETELQRIDRRQLSTAWAIDHELISDRITAELFTLSDLKPYDWDVQAYNEVIGGAFYYLTIPPEDPARWPDRLEAVLARMQALPGFLEAARANLKAPPRVFTEFVIAQNKGNLDIFEKSLPALFAPYPALAARFEALRPATTQAIRDFQGFLEGDLLARSTGDWRLGRRRWERKLGLTLQSNQRSEDLAQAAARALELTRLEMYDVALPLHAAMFPGDRSHLELSGDERINHVVGRVITEVSQREHGTPESIFDDVRRHAERIKAFIREVDLVALPPPTDRFTVEPTPAFLDGLAVAFYNPAPAFEPDLKKSYWISSVPKPGTEDAESYLREYNDHILQALTIHEAFPGHYVQLYWSSHSPTASITKQVLESGTMAEGWACMIEQLMHEAGYSRGDPKSYLFHLKMRLRVFLNAIIDERLHTSTEDEESLDRWALDLMMSKGFQERAEATRKLRRAKLTSTQLSTYFVGYREMLGLYRRAQAKAGKDFVPRRFLEKMIGYGTIPPRIIERLLVEEGAL